jgi:hypothetical protein
MTTYHKCYICKQDKPLECFHKDRTTKDGFNFRCKDCNKTYKKEYHKTYCKSEAYKKIRKQRYWDNPQKEREENQRRRKANIEHFKLLAKKSYRKNIRQVLLTQSRQRAKKYHYEHNITIEDIIIPDVCPVLGIPISISETKASPNSPSLDRTDNTKGYIKGNVKIISFRANTLKSDASIEELEKILKYLYEIQRSPS